MRTRIIISLVVVAAFIFLSQPAIADDLADLKATHQQIFTKTHVLWKAGISPPCFSLFIESKTQN